ncbi:YrbL family protein [Desulfofustis glycolicus]|uniref:PhoP regulatory network protein YrbL n=1 Tax=Desulfofustis glycolicus DSM 9705 TaxID=1121409 RepID=A0A1M5RVZ9_9BACT|nr:YrbL family protein [Desulfofustis glycolicus]SHH30416.1 PhoP regulatory network protein YrbL [Desulfofustis glycolicus DSM 9705]
MAGEQEGQIIADVEKPLVLSDELLINRGRGRLCFRHPTDRSLVIKVPAGTGNADQSANRKEWQGYRDLIRRHGRLSCISHCHGFVATDRGTGLVCDCIRDAHGTIARSIYDIIVFDDACDITRVLAVAEIFGRYLLERDIRLFDLNPKNIALVLEQDGGYRAVALDLKGRFDNNEFIPLSSYVGFFARRKMRRRTRQLLERIRFFHEHRDRYRARQHHRQRDGL